MEETFDYSDVPYYYDYCFQFACPLAARCLRCLAGRHVPPEVLSVRAVNPALCPTGEDDRCPMFQPIVRVRIAWGVKRMVERMPYKEARVVNRWLNERFSRAVHSRIVHYRRPISPAEQADILSVFRSLGVEDEDVFDYYTYTYDWEAKQQ